MARTLLSDPRLRGYVDDVRAWHGYVRFLGLPTIQDHPDTPMSDLFVVPALAEERVAPEAPLASWPPSGELLPLLEAESRVVILGDPGSGKSSIVNWLAWLLAGGAANVLPPRLEDCLPIPLIARELKLDGIDRFDALIGAFLERPVAQRLRGQRPALLEALQDGRAMVLLDGLDEVPLVRRRSLRDAVRDGWKRFPAMRFVATSRSVGYDECALDEADDPAQASIPLEPTRSRHGSTRSHPVALRHVMPFDDRRIGAFAQQWYALRSLRAAAEQDANAFVGALQREPTVLELARTPQLLTLMALVFRVRAQLPDGRAVLYDMITEAYLESIDRARALGSTSTDLYPWREKRRWLARVGFEMQLLRRADGESGGRELLATRAQVLGWVGAAMERSSYPNDAGFADAYVNWVARRSGLLLPRGEDLFAFVHLSFQEYFAALYIAEQAADVDWVIAQRDGSTHDEGDARITALALSAWARDRLWQEVLVFAQEGFAHAPKDARRFAGWLFGDGFLAVEADIDAALAAEAENDTSFAGAASARAELLARVLTNPHSGLTPIDRKRGLGPALRFLDVLERLFDGYVRTSRASTTTLRRLLQSELTAGEFWANVVARAPSRLNLWYGGRIDATRLEPLSRLQHLALDGIENDNLLAFRALEQLEVLFIGTAPEVASLQPIAALVKLRELLLFRSKVADLTPLSGLKQLKELAIWGAPIESLQPLIGLAALEVLDVSRTRISSVEPLRQCAALRELNIILTSVDDLSPLDKLPRLSTLATSVRLTPALQRRQQLEQLKVHETDL